MLTSSHLTFRFRQSRADAWPWLVRLAQQGDFRQQTLGPKQIVYETTFDLTNPQHLAPAISLSTELVHQPTAEALVAGQLLAIPLVRMVLLCYQQSSQIDDYRAHCWIRHAFVEDPNQPATFYLDLDGKTRRWLFPCRAAVKHKNEIHPEHPTPIREQVEAALVRGQTWWCPRLNLDEWEPLQWIRPVSKQAD